MDRQLSRVITIGTLATSLACVVCCVYTFIIGRPPYETTAQAGFSDPANKHMPSSSERCDVFKPPFQIRDPGRDGKSKMLCGIKTNEVHVPRFPPGSCSPALIILALCLTLRLTLTLTPGLPHSLRRTSWMPRS